MKSAISRTVLVNLIVNGGLALQTRLRENRLIVSYHQISWHLKKRSENVKSLKNNGAFPEGFLEQERKGIQSQTNKSEGNSRVSYVRVRYMLIRRRKILEHNDKNKLAQLRFS